MFTLLPENKKKELILEYRFRLFSVFFIALAFVFLIGIVSILPSFVFVKTELNAQVKEKDFILSTISNKTDPELKETLANLKQNTKILSTEDFLPSLYVDAVVRNKTGGVRITSLRIDKNQADVFLINGIANTRQDLLLFSKTLEATTFFERVNIPISNYAKESNIQFNIEGIFEGVNDLKEPETLQEGPLNENIDE